VGSTLFVCCTFLAAVAAVAWRGTAWAFGCVLVSYLLLVPQDISLTIEGLPDLSPQRAVVLGMLFGALATGRLRGLFPRWRLFDLLPLGMTLGYSVSFGLRTDLHGFFYQLVILTLDWALPYIYARAVLRDPEALRRLVAPIAVCGTILALFALYEARINVRLMAELWNLVGGHEVPPFWTEFTGALRWGLLRAYGPFGHPLILATVLVTIAPLALCWGWLDRRRRFLALGAALAIVVGTIAPVSRGPLLVLGTTSVFFALVAWRVPALVLCGAALLALSPVVAQKVQDVVQSTRADLETEGNTDSARYRAALLLIYLDELDELGPFGNVEVVGTRYQAAWSIDNSFLYMLITGGWIGGGLLLAIALLVLFKGYRALVRSSGRERLVRAAIMASFVGMSGCIANVWFTPEFSGLYLVLAALVWNQSAPGWYSNPRRARAGVALVSRPAPLRTRTLELPS
jgi:hypothetical protein